MEPSSACTTRCTSRAARPPDGRRARRPPSSTAKASRARKRGARVDPSGYDAGKKIKGKKRHVLVDTQGLPMHALVHAADVQDRDGGVRVMATLFVLSPFLLKLYADSGYQGPAFQAGVRRICRDVEVEVVKRFDTAESFTVPSKRWIVERTIAWLNRCRRLAKIGNA